MFRCWFDAVTLFKPVVGRSVGRSVPRFLPQSISQLVSF